MFSVIIAANAFMAMRRRRRKAKAMGPGRMIRLLLDENRSEYSFPQEWIDVLK